MNILVIGDVHGRVEKYFELLSPETPSIQLGDFGFSGSYEERKEFFERESFDPKKHVFFGGNHDDYDHYFDLQGSLGDFGPIPFIPNSFFVRGAKSIDKEKRTKGHDWWKKEELSWAESNRALREYINEKPKQVFSHDAPQQAAEKLFSWKGDISPSHTRKLLSEMFEAHKPKQWFFGHWHETARTEIKRTEFQCLGELETKTIEI